MPASTTEPEAAPAAPATAAPDRLMRLLTAVGSVYVPLTTRPRRRPRPAPAPRPAAHRLVVLERRAEAEDVVSLLLAAPDGAPLPPWQPGAHLDIELPSGLRRQYSLCGDPADRAAYRIAVRRIPGGSGSVEVHQALTQGARLTAGRPRNAFPFAGEPSLLLIAGGIGITPLLPMAREAASRGLDWRLVHTGRSRASMPFAAELRRLGERAQLLPDDEHGVPDPAELLRRAPAGAAVYACGPAPMLDGIRAAFAASPAAALHFERFTPPPVRDGRPFTLRLARSGRELAVPADRSALDVLRDADPATPYSCRQGFCGVCRQRVLDGVPEHRDRRLTDAERAGGEMLVCVSRAAEGRTLTLDL